MKDSFRRLIRDKLFIYICVYFGISILSALILTVIPMSKYVKQAAYVVGIIAIILWIRAMWMAYRKFFRRKVRRRSNKFFARLEAFLLRIDDAIRKALHLSPRAYYFGGEDEEILSYQTVAAYSNAATTEGKVRIKWKNLEENRQKIRFLFAKFMLDKMAGGYKLKYSATARQLGEQFADTERSRMLFDLYEDVRYTDHMPEIEDDVIKFLQQKETSVSDDKKKKKKH